MDEHSEQGSGEGTDAQQPKNTQQEHAIEPDTSIAEDSDSHQTVIAEGDIEPATSSTMPSESSSPNLQSTESTLEPSPQEPASAPIVAATTKTNRRPIIIAAASLVFLVIVSIAVAWLLRSMEPSTREDSTSSTPIEQPKLGVAMTVADGTVEFKKPEMDWQLATIDTELGEGDSIRTLVDSRAVLTLDDGSAVRLDADSTIALVDLSVDHVQIEQVDGTVYSRVVTNSERRYVISTDDATYEALGTAFTTTKTAARSGVQVYHSSVKTSLVGEPVAEGKQCYKTGTDVDQKTEVSDIDIDALVSDTFINWNLLEDEKDASLKDKLGILPHIKERAEAIEKERESAEEAARLQAEKAAEEKAEAEAAAAKQREEEKQSTASKGKVERGTMTLAKTGGTLTWSYTGKAIYGYKLVYSKKTSSPVFGKDSSIYFSGINNTSTDLSATSIDDGKYYVRVCAYTAGTESEGCVDYSDFIVVTI